MRVWTSWERDVEWMRRIGSVILMEKEEDIGFVCIWKIAEEIFVFCDVQVLL